MLPHLVLAVEQVARSAYGGHEDRPLKCAPVALHHIRSPERAPSSADAGVTFSCPVRDGEDGLRGDDAYSRMPWGFGTWQDERTLLGGIG